MLYLVLLGLIITVGLSLGVDQRLIAAILFISLGLLYWYTPTDTQDDESIQKRTENRRIAIILMIIGTILGIWGVCSRTVTKNKAAMYPGRSCSGCEVYANRHDSLRGYTQDEYEILKRVSQSCNDCSRECITDYQNQQARGAPREIQNFTKQECIATTEYALLAKQELDRLTENLLQKRAAITAFKAREFGDVSGFPNVVN